DGEDITAQAAFICVEHQGERQRMFSGRHAYQLGRENGSFRIKMKRVDLLNCDGVHAPITIPLYPKPGVLMVQVKKASVRNAITESAYELFSRRGYNATTLLDIAQMAGTGVSSLYSYFPSKLHLLYAVVEPWQKDAFERLAARVEGIAE